MAPVGKANEDRPFPLPDILHTIRANAKPSNPGIFGTVVGCIKDTLGYLGGGDDTAKKTDHAKYSNDSSSTALFCIDYESGISPRPVGRLLMLQPSKDSQGRPKTRPSCIVVPRKAGTSLHKVSQRGTVVNSRRAQDGDDDDDGDEAEDDADPTDSSGVRLSIDMQKDGTKVNLYPTKSLSGIKRRRGLKSIMKRRTTTPRKKRVLRFDIDDDDDDDSDDDDDDNDDDDDEDDDDD